MNHHAIEANLASAIIKRNLNTITECFVFNIRSAYYWPIFTKNSRYSAKKLHQLGAVIATAMCSGIDLEAMALGVFNMCGDIPFANQKAADAFLDIVGELDI